MKTVHFVIVVCVVLSALCIPNETGATGTKGDGTVAGDTLHEGKVMPLRDLRLHIVYDNRSHKESFEPAWGFSCLVTGTPKTILFDTGGDGEVLLDNFERFGIIPDTVDVIVLSHEHWDHIGGMARFAEKNDRASVFLLKSFSGKFKESLRRCGIDVVNVDKPVEICPGVSSTGKLGVLIKEHALYIRTDKGLVVITGCAHPGIVKIVEKSRDLSGDDILFVVGGFHLGGTGERELRRIISDFKKLGVRYAAPCHCSGEAAIELFREAYGEYFIDVGAGSIITADDFK